MNNINTQFNYNFSLLPDKCSIREGNRDCVNPPEYVITVVSTGDEFMLGITCERHKDIVSTKILELQANGKIPKGKLQFEKLKAVGTDCVRIDADELIQLD